MPNIRIADMTPTKYGGKSGTVKMIFNRDMNDTSFEYWEEQMKYAASQGKNYEMQRVPCGVCPSCRLQQSREWAARIMMEASKYDCNYFVTLTYDDEHKPFDEVRTLPDGRVFTDDGTWNGYLEKKDVQDFLKRLRIHWKRKYDHDDIRFFMCGEYGTQTERPHYHIIFFNLPIYDYEDLKVVNGKPLFTSPEIREIWGKGHISIGEVEFASAAYVARYAMKKRTGTFAAEHYARKGQTPEYVNMSRKPGIGKDWYDAHKQEIYDTDNIINVELGKLKGKPPRYFDRLYDLEYPEDMERIKKQRKESGERARKTRMAQTTATERQQYAYQERGKAATAQWKREPNAKLG